MNTHTDGHDEQPHSDTVIVDALTAFLNHDPQPSGADAVALLCDLISRSGRPLLADPWPLHAQVTEDRYGIPTAAITAGPYRLRVSQLEDGPGDLLLHVDRDDRDSQGIRYVLGGDQQPNPPVLCRHCYPSPPATETSDPPGGTSP